MNHMLLINVQCVLNTIFLWVGAISLFDGRIKRIWSAILCYIGFLCVVLQCEFAMDFVAFLAGILNIVCYILTITFSSEYKSIKKICVFFILLYLQELLEMMLDSIIFLFNKEIDRQEWDVNHSLWSLGVLIVFSFVYSKNKNFLRSSRFKKYIRKNLIPLLIFVAFEVVAMVVWYNISLENNASLKSYLVGSMLSVSSMLSIGIIVVMVIYVKHSNDTMEHMLALEQLMKQLQAEYYETLLEKEAATRRYRHDMNNHLICLRRLIEDGDIEGTKGYIDEMNANLQEIKKKSYYTGITILDVLLNYYIEQIEADVNVNGHCECDIAVTDIDLCIIFSNLIQNAVEALNRSCGVDGFLNVVIKEGKEFVRIKICNSIWLEKFQLDAKGDFQTIKKDKQNHGLGMLNVRETVYKNEGTIEYRIEDRQISCEVILPIRRV